MNNILHLLAMESMGELDTRQSKIARLKKAAMTNPSFEITQEAEKEGIQLTPSETNQILFYGG